MRRVDAVIVRPLRHHVLRPGADPAESVYPGDGLPSTVHFGAFDDGTLVGTATIFPEPLQSRPAWRLRGMAVDEPVRNQGVGSALLAEVLDHVRRSDVDRIWCNARTVALSFYAGHGFVVVGGEFLSGSGVPHYLALLEVDAGEGVESRGLI